MGKKKQTGEEKQVTDNEERFINFLVKSGYLVNPKIKDPKLREKKQEDNKKAYHNTLLMLEHYRDLVWSMECIPEDLMAELNVPMEQLDALITRLDLEMSMDNWRVESRLQSILRSRMLLDRLNEAIAFLRSKPQDGEKLYRIIYRTYIGEKMESVYDVMASLGLTKNKYYSLRRKAITIIGMKLWSAPEANFELWVELLSMLDG